MSKGTPSFGKHQTITHIRCRRCGRHSYHINKQKCAACGFPRAKIKQEAWRRKTWTRSGRRNVKVMHMKQKTAWRGREIK